MDTEASKPPGARRAGQAALALRSTCSRHHAEEDKSIRVSHPHRRHRFAETPPGHGNIAHKALVSVRLLLSNIQYMVLSQRVPLHNLSSSSSPQLLLPASCGPQPASEAARDTAQLDRDCSIDIGLLGRAAVAAEEMEVARQEREVGAGDADDRVDGSK